MLSYSLSLFLYLPKLENLLRYESKELSEISHTLTSVAKSQSKEWKDGISKDKQLVLVPTVNGRDPGK